MKFTSCNCNRLSETGDHCDAGSKDFQELADEAFADLLRKHNRPTDLKTALRESVGMEKQPPAAAVKRGGRRKAAGNDNDR